MAQVNSENSIALLAAADPAGALFFRTRRSFLACLAAAAPVAAMASLPAVAAAEPDPTFAAIAAHERAAEAYSVALLIEANRDAVELAAEADTEAANRRGEYDPDHDRWRPRAAEVLREW